jgi:hypothetical protein
VRWAAAAGYFSVALLLVAAEIYCSVRVVTGWPDTSGYMAGVVVFFSLYWFVWPRVFAKIATPLLLGRMKHRTHDG